MLLQNTLRPLRSVAITLAVGATLFSAVPSAKAGATEIKALQAALPSGVTLDTATSQQLYDAFIAVSFTTGTKFDTTKEQAVVAGEALKAAGPNAVDAGEFFGQMIAASTSGDQLSAIFDDRRNFVAVAASTAGAGKGLNVSQIPGFASTVFVNELGTTFTTVAQATKSKPGIGAIFAGRARQLFASSGTPLDDSVVLTNSILFDKKLAASAQDITQWIASEIGANSADSADYAVRVSDGNAGGNNKLALKIAVGVSAGDPTNAGNILHNLLSQDTLQANGSLATPTTAPSPALFATIVKGATVLAKSISTVADIEEIQKIGNALGQLIAKPGVKAGTGQIAVSKAAGFVKTLATAVMLKPRAVTDPLGTDITDRNSNANKADEIAEIAAYMVGGMVGSPEFNLTGLDAKKSAVAVKKAATAILAIIKSAVSVKPKVVAKQAQGPQQADFAADVAASVALTVLNSSMDQLIKDAVKDLLLLTDTKGAPKTAASILKTATTQIFDRLTDVYAGTDLGRFEDGNDPTKAVSDPETDSHTFS